jgi:hypothetical protein
MNIMLHGSMVYILGMLRSLQMIIHLPMLRIIVPANVSMFFSIIIPVVMFDIIAPEYSTELVLDFEEDDQVEFNQMADLGYETHNSILNLGSIALFLSIYFFKIIALLSLWLIRKYTPKCKENYKSLYKQVFFAELIGLLLEAYFELLITSFLNIKEKDHIGK